MIGTEGLGAGCPLAAGKCVEIAWRMEMSSMYIIAPNLFGGDGLWRERHLCHDSDWLFICMGSSLTVRCTITIL
jgi:hypothetical protein